MSIADLALRADQLAWHCDPAQFEFSSTEQVESLDGFLGQDRALDAVEFGIGMRHVGYNLFVLGPQGVGKQTVVQEYLEKSSAGQPSPSDWCYVHNFEHSHKPRALEFPEGRGNQFSRDVERLVEDLKSAIPAALESEDHKNRVSDVEQDVKEQHDEEIKVVAKKAADQQIRLVRTSAGFAMAPVKDDEVLDPEEFEKLPKEQREEVEGKIKKLQEELQKVIEKIPQWRREVRDQVRDLNREATQRAVGSSFRRLRNKYEQLSEVVEHLKAMEEDVVQHAERFLPQEPADDEGAAMLQAAALPALFRRYEVNLLVDHRQTEGAPVVFEDHPTHRNLVGSVEHRAQMGTLQADFTLIKDGSLHRANGGYLIIDAHRILMQPFAWESLKRALQSRTIRIESPGESLSPLSTISLEPEPIPLDVKVVLLGDRMLYYLMHQSDRDFPELFKVAADFEESLDRSPEIVQLYARLVAGLARKQEIRPLDQTAVARVLEQGVRLAGDSEKITTEVRKIADLLREADYWADQVDADVITREHVQRAIEKQIYRVDRIRERMQEQILRGTILIDTDGERVGQVNGLSVLQIANFNFGKPARITATVRVGRGEVIDIEREVELGGSLHSKGVLIISAYLASTFATNSPLSLAASLVFEQSYGMVDGDSASVAELCALLSSLARLPIRQRFAVTGSVNQHGQVQAIGGVNEKIEGFFDVCRERGLTGEQAVLIPAANVKHLMLRRDVVEAVERGEFAVYAVDHIDQAVELLLGVPAGSPDEQGEFPEGTVNRRVAERLEQMVQIRKKFEAEKEQLKEDLK